MKALVRLGVVLLVIGALAVAADRGADRYAETRTSSALEPTFGASTDVSVEGFPFLTQWAAGRFREVNVQSDGVTVSGTKVRDLRMTLANVRGPAYARTERDVQSSTAGSVRMSGTVPYGELPVPGAVTAKNVHGRDDRLRLSGSIGVLGERVRFSAVVRVSPHDDKVRLQPRQVRILGEVPSAAITGLVRDNLDVQVTPPGLPPGMKISGLKTRDDGLRLTATGRDVQVPRS